MEVTRSAYYAWAAGKKTPVGKQAQQLQAQVTPVFYAHRRRYGSRRIVQEVKSQGGEIGRSVARRVMRELGLRALQPRRFSPKTTNSDHVRASANRLKVAANQVRKPGAVIVGDIRVSAHRKRQVLLSGELAGQVHAAHHRVENRPDDDGRIGACGVAKSAAPGLDRAAGDHPHGSRESVLGKEFSAFVGTPRTAPIHEREGQLL